MKHMLEPILKKDPEDVTLKIDPTDPRLKIDPTEAKLKTDAMETHDAIVNRPNMEYALRERVQLCNMGACFGVCASL
jgi:hypothetical protein